MNYKKYILCITIIVCCIPYKAFSLYYNGKGFSRHGTLTKAGTFFSPGSSISQTDFFSPGKKNQINKKSRVNVAVQKRKKEKKCLKQYTIPGFFSSAVSSQIMEMKFVKPVSGVITRRFAYRVHPRTKRKIYYHRGIDISAVRGTLIKAAFAGTVVTSCYNRGGYGHLVIIKHPNNVYTYYGHLHKRNVKKGQTIKKGEIIGTVGSTGRSTGPHLHFEIRIKNIPINPSLKIDFN